MVLKRLIGLVFAGALVSALGGRDCGARPAAHIYTRDAGPRPAVTMCGYPGTIVTTTTPTPGPRAVGAASTAHAHG